MRSAAGTTFGNEDRNLNSSLFVLYGVGNQTQDKRRFLIHAFTGDAIPTLSVQRFNPVMDSNADIIMQTVRHNDYANISSGWSNGTLYRRSAWLISLSFYFHYICWASEDSEN